jgi:hypothetical protein
MADEENSNDKKTYREVFRNVSRKADGSSHSAEFERKLTTPPPAVPVEINRTEKTFKKGDETIHVKGEATEYKTPLTTIHTDGDVETKSGRHVKVQSDTYIFEPLAGAKADAAMPAGDTVKNLMEQILSPNSAPIPSDGLKSEAGKATVKATPRIPTH